LHLLELCGGIHWGFLHSLQRRRLQFLFVGMQLPELFSRIDRPHLHGLRCGALQRLFGGLLVFEL